MSPGGTLIKGHVCTVIIATLRLSKPRRAVEFWNLHPRASGPRLHLLPKSNRLMHIVSVRIRLLHYKSDNWFAFVVANVFVDLQKVEAAATLTNTLHALTAVLDTPDEHEAAAWSQHLLHAEQVIRNPTWPSTHYCVQGSLI